MPTVKIGERDAGRATLKISLNKSFSRDKREYLSFIGIDEDRDSFKIKINDIKPALINADTAASNDTQFRKTKPT